jgi:hypothetical protein
MPALAGMSRGGNSASVTTERLHKQIVRRNPVVAELPEVVRDFAVQ